MRSKKNRKELITINGIEPTRITHKGKKSKLQELNKENFPVNRYSVRSFLVGDLHMHEDPNIIHRRYNSTPGQLTLDLANKCIRVVTHVVLTLYFESEEDTIQYFKGLINGRVISKKVRKRWRNSSRFVKPKKSLEDYANSEEVTSPELRKLLLSINENISL